MILNEFDSLRPADLADVDSTLMAEIYKGRTTHPLHLAVTTGREVRARTLHLCPSLLRQCGSHRDHNNGTPRG